ncbi:hypothetical protein ACKI1I_31300 [Streptomyces turgidiscabies]|uniref:Uncharacterized protein n=1 Tax=Streptomyces turgidiscabies (strain Car8) TaxID=698760 RepID=L7FE88_STRT8|nr:MULTISPECIES: hypothetical protein [Streptomyces]ELP69524.1 hypothetical protein STRTUCAR8_00596 [Streptomyces turgidiscabies Car8]MDX3496129.1 hypothetical protein [Streptomyces turgidiscabies]GAQ75377.1 hypothetical protein T45_07158 [Streptomyces turgidiscabies]
MHGRRPPATEFAHEAHIDDPAPPAELGLDIALEGTASSLSGKATIHGTVRCTKPVQATVTDNVTQVEKREIIRGSYSTSVSCAPGAHATWTRASPVSEPPIPSSKTSTPRPSVSLATPSRRDSWDRSMTS